jgi:hypothetical protein
MMTAVTQCEIWKTSGTVIPAATPSTKTTRLNQPTQVFRLVVPPAHCAPPESGPIKHARHPSRVPRKVFFAGQRRFDLPGPVECLFFPGAARPRDLAVRGSRRPVTDGKYRRPAGAGLRRSSACTQSRGLAGAWFAAV